MLRVIATFLYFNQLNRALQRLSSSSESEVRGPAPTLPVLEVVKSKAEQLGRGRMGSSHFPSLALPTFASLGESSNIREVC